MLVPFKDDDKTLTDTKTMWVKLGNLFEQFPNKNTPKKHVENNTSMRMSSPLKGTPLLPFGPQSHEKQGLKP